MQGYFKGNTVGIILAYYKDRGSERKRNRTID